MNFNKIFEKIIGSLAEVSLFFIWCMALGFLIVTHLLLGPIWQNLIMTGMFVFGSIGFYHMFKEFREAMRV